MPADRYRSRTPRRMERRSISDLQFYGASFHISERSQKWPIHFWTGRDLQFLNRPSQRLLRLRWPSPYIANYQSESSHLFRVIFLIIARVSLCLLFWTGCASFWLSSSRRGSDNDIRFVKATPTRYQTEPAFFIHRIALLNRVFHYSFTIKASSTTKFIQHLRWVLCRFHIAKRFHDYAVFNQVGRTDDTHGDFA